MRAFAVLMVALLAGCSSGGSPDALPTQPSSSAREGSDGPGVFQSRISSLTLEYPRTWTARMMKTGPDVDGEYALFTGPSGVSLTIRNTRVAGDLRSFADCEKDRIDGEGPRIISCGTVTWNSISWTRVETESELPTERTIEARLFRDQTLFRIYGTVTVSSVDESPEGVETLDRIFASMRFS